MTHGNHVTELLWVFTSLFHNEVALSIQVCPKKGINPTILLWGWDWDHQTYSREGYGSLGLDISFPPVVVRISLNKSFWFLQVIQHDHIFLSPFVSWGRSLKGHLRITFSLTIINKKSAAEVARLSCVLLVVFFPQDGAPPNYYFRGFIPSYTHQPTMVFHRVKPGVISLPTL